MLQKEQLETMKVDELRSLLKENGISYYKNSKRITKIEMIERYLEEMSTIVEMVDKYAREDELAADMKEAAEKAEKLEAERLEKKKKYIEQAKVGTLVAFRCSDGKVISGIIVKKSTKSRKFMIETKYGIEYKISFDDVLWVKTNKRWPKGIYLLFKKGSKTEEKHDDKEIS